MKGTTQVDGGHILRSTGKKDRHSKVYTAKGPRDRRVRLSAHTAIQFYDVQDRLGYDRPSKAVDWLIKKAKAAIDNLNEPPPPLLPWQQPHTPTPESNPSSSDLALDRQSSKSVCEYDFQNNNNNNNNNNNSRCSNSAFLVAAAGEADLMNTMRSFFPTTSFGGFDSDPCQGSPFQADDLGLSLQTFQAGSRASSNMPFHGSFQRIDGWNGGGSGIFSQGNLSFTQRELLQSNAAANQWNQRPLISANRHDDNDDDNPQPRGGFELGFRVPARIYGEEEAAENHR